MPFDSQVRTKSEMQSHSTPIRSPQPRRWAPWGWSLLAHAALLGGAWWLISTAPPVTRPGIRPIFTPAAVAVAPAMPAPPQTPTAAREAMTPAPNGLPGWSQRPPEPIRLAGFGGASQAAMPGVVNAAAAPPIQLQGDSNAAAGLFPLPRQPRAATAASVFSEAGQAPTVAFVCDASGSMSGERLAPLKIELRQAIDSLQPIQAFTIIFFKQERTESLSRRLVMANESNKRRAAVFLEGIESGGATDPVAGLNQAFDARPAIIYLLTDGDFPDTAAVLRCIARRNPRRSVKINTIAFLGSGTRYEALLRRIAADNGGTFKRVTRDELMNTATKGQSDEATRERE